MGVFGGAAVGSGLILPGTLLLMMVLLDPCMVHGTGEQTKAPPAAAHFLLQSKSECRFANGTAGAVRYLKRYIYGREEYARFDSRRGAFEALTPLGEFTAQYLNSQKECMANMRARVDVICRHNYGVEEGRGLLTRKAQPTVKISHTQAGPLAHHSLLLCTATGYYPSGVRFRWLKNGQEQMEGVGYADEFQNGDWTFQNQAMLETVPQRRDVYTCQVEHSSLKEPITVQWEPEMSDSSKSKMWIGGVGALLGAAFGAVALSLHLKNRRAAPTAPAAGVLS
ncbi:UNVERIFIED_CONTAM: hypothetical protein K2H54_066425 [Gekko kuhli]